MPASDPHHTCWIASLCVFLAAEPFLLVSAGKAACGHPGKAEWGSTLPDQVSYLSGDTVDYLCKPGYTPSMANTRGTCLRNGTWDFLPAPCGKDYSFDSPVSVDKEFPVKTSTTYHSVLTDHNPSTCADVDLGLSLKIDVHINKIYNPLKIEIALHEDVSGRYKLDTKVAVKRFGAATCYQGDLLSRNPVYSGQWHIKCSQLSPHWDSVNLLGSWFQHNTTLSLCDIEVSRDDGNYTCPSPPVPLNGHNNWEKGKVLVTFGCYSGFHLVGHSKSRCQNGRWSFDAQPECLPFEPRCPYPGDPYNGQTVPRKDVYQVNETVRYQCAEGFSTTGVGKGTCQSNGSWDFRPSPCGIDLAFRTQPFTSFGLDLDHLSRFHPELVDRNESTCFNLGGLALLGGSKPWLIGWNRLATLPEFPILRFVFDPEDASVKDLKELLERNQAWIQRHQVYSNEWIFRLTTKNKNTLRIFFTNIPQHLKLCEIHLVDSKKDSNPYPCGTPPSSLDGTYLKKPSGDGVEYGCVSSHHRMVGPSSLNCREDGEWSGNPPICILDPGLSSNNDNSSSYAIVSTVIITPAIIAGAVFAYRRWNQQSTESPTATQNGEGSTNMEWISVQSPLNVIRKSNRYFAPRPPMPLPNSRATDTIERAGSVHSLDSQNYLTPIENPNQSIDPKVIGSVACATLESLENTNVYEAVSAKESQSEIYDELQDH